MNLRVAIAGASGYAGGEVARLLASHPSVSEVTLTAHTHAGKAVAEVHPHLASYADQTFLETTPQVLADHDVVVLALPHGESGLLGEKLVKAKTQRLLIDLAADRRLVDPSAWERFYGGKYHAPFVYGMPELRHADGSSQRDRIAEADAVVAPGCNASAVTLALAPLLHGGVISPLDVSAVLVVGPSGAGRTLRPDLLGAELMGSAHAYAVAGSHRHIPEIIQNLNVASDAHVSLSLTPVLAPMSRGILATVTAKRTGDQQATEIHQVMAQAYATEPFVRVLPLGSYPKTGDVLGSNTVSIGVGVDEAVNRVIVVAALDNLVKGTAGAAVQSMNVALGLPEALGLTVDGIAP